MHTVSSRLPFTQSVPSNVPPIQDDDAFPRDEPLTAEEEAEMYLAYMARLEAERNANAA